MKLEQQNEIEIPNEATPLLVPGSKSTESYLQREERKQETSSETKKRQRLFVNSKANSFKKDSHRHMSSMAINSKSVAKRKVSFFNEDIGMAFKPVVAGAEELGRKTTMK